MIKVEKIKTDKREAYPTGTIEFTGELGPEITHYLDFNKGSISDGFSIEYNPATNLEYAMRFRATDKEKVQAIQTFVEKFNKEREV